VEEIFPELVESKGATSDGQRSLSYSGFAPLLVEAVKEQQRLIEHQRQAGTSS
jgi:hypothetical protein